MITTSDIGDIIYKYLKRLDIMRYHEDTFPAEELDDERISIIVKEQVDGRIWDRCFVDVNVCVPDRQGVKNRARLSELERKVKKLFNRDVAGSHDGTTYRFRKHSFAVLSDQSLRIHFINTRILFESQKVIN